MATTIQISEQTVATLKNYRDVWNASSYDQVIGNLVRIEKSHKSMYGAGKKRMGMKKILEGLRDENDRI